MVRTEPGQGLELHLSFQKCFCLCLTDSLNLSFVHFFYLFSFSPSKTGLIAEARLKELTPAVPVIFIRAIPVDKQENRTVYQCPVYKTRQRGPTYVWTFNLKTKETPAKWTLAGVALLLQI